MSNTGHRFSAGVVRDLLTRVDGVRGSPGPASIPAEPNAFGAGSPAVAVTADVSPEVEDLLESEPLLAHLATCADGRPHVAPVWYRYEDGVVSVLTTGRKLANVRANPRVAISVQKDDRGHARWMVALLGTARVVEDEDATAAAARRINAKYGAGDTAWPENTLVRIDVGSATVRRY